MMRNSFFFFLSLSCFLSPVISWGYIGHNVIAQLGQNMLTPEGMEMVNSLLGEGETMVSIANWPDHYSDTDEGSWSSCLHYVNIEDQGDHLYWYSRDCGGVGSVDHCCVAASVLNYTVQVGEEVHGKGRRKEKEEEDQQKLLFGKKFLFSGGDSDANLTGEPTPLSFMIHFVGDTHQPLHCGYGCDAGFSLLLLLLLLLLLF